MAFSPDRRDMIVYTVFAYANALLVLVLLAGALVTARRPAPPDTGSIADEQRTTAEANLDLLAASLRSYAVVSKKRRPQLDIHIFGLPGASSLNSAIETRVLDAIDDAGGFDGRTAFEPTPTAPAHRWSTTSFTSPSSLGGGSPSSQSGESAHSHGGGPPHSRGENSPSQEESPRGSQDGERIGDPHTLDIRTTVLTAGGRFVVTALRQASSRSHTAVLLTDLSADTTVDAKSLFSARVDPAAISTDDTGSLTVDGQPVADADLTAVGKAVAADLHTPLEIPRPGDLRTPDYSCTLLPCVALTYDDGPGEPKTEDALLDAADEANIRLTYFLLGQNIHEFPDVAERIAAAGHEVDNHTFKHQRLDLLSKGALKHEIGRTQKSLSHVGGSDPALVRPPYGALDKPAAHALGAPAIIWDVDTGDWRDKNPKKTVQNVRSHARPGSVVLMHSIHPSTVKAAPKVFTTVADKGLYAVTVRELFAGIKWEKGGSYFCRGYWDELCSNPEHPSVHKN
ncbi:polysaccharide deacetylase family protein [Brevibacterium oceani]|uniref:polysaccharide deacetylase family protein n=1 Tax=Brevibacterium oceani TaxID=358099 RepID=UPI0015E71023|nr:polysaccharide deacetylase family protein [Brevibacterium oceani]